MKLIGLLVLHVISLYYLHLLWRDKETALKRGSVLTKVGVVGKKRSPRMFYFSIWVDFIVLAVLYTGLIIYSVFVILKL